MHVRTASLAAGIAILLAAPPVRAQAPNCSGTISGAINGAFDCTVAMGKGGGGRISFVLTPATEVPGAKAFAPGSLEIRGPLEMKTYPTQALVEGKASLTSSGGAVFSATGGKRSKGEQTLTIANMERYAQLAGRYVLNGTYQARLVPDGKGKKGEVVVDVQFSVATDVLD